MENNENNETLKDMILQASGHAGKSQNFATEDELNEKHKKIRIEIDIITAVAAVIVFILVTAAGVIFASTALANERFESLQKSQTALIEQLPQRESENVTQSDSSPASSAPSCENTETNAATNEAVDASGIVNINKASAAELQTLPGIGPAIADRIVEYRLKNGAFKKPHDITNVKGIGDAMWNKIKDKVRTDAP